MMLSIWFNETIIKDQTFSTSYPNEKMHQDESKSEPKLCMRKYRA